MKGPNKLFLVRVGCRVLDAHHANEPGRLDEAVLLTGHGVVPLEARVERRVLRARLVHHDLRGQFAVPLIQPGQFLTQIRHSDHLDVLARVDLVGAVFAGALRAPLTHADPHAAGIDQ